MRNATQGNVYYFFKRFTHPYTPTYLSVYFFLGKKRLVSHLRTGSSYHFNAA